MKKILLSTVLGVASLAATATNAANGLSDTTSFQVKLNITESCEFEDKTDINFDTLPRSLGAKNQATSNLSVNCTLGTPYTISLAGSGQMKNQAGSASVVPYSLYQDANYQTAWDKQSLLSKTGTGRVESHTVYAQLSGNTNVEAGDYADTVTATVNY